MAYYTFSFENTNSDQSFTYKDERDDGADEYDVGPINHNDTSPQCRCWVGSDGHGEITLTGSVSGKLHQDILYDEYSFRY